MSRYDVPRPKGLEHVTPSAELRAQLAAEGRPILLAFSRGKDSLAAWLACLDAGIQVVPYHLYLVPGLSFVEASLRDAEAFFGVPRIAQYPHPSLYRVLQGLVCQPAERARHIEAANLPVPDYIELNTLVRQDLGLAEDTWVVDGVRAVDSPMRRTAMKVHGPVKQNGLQQKIVWDWRKQHVLAAIDAAGAKLPVDYEMFKRSFDGWDDRFLREIRKRFPEDYRRCLEWLPFAELDALRRELPDAPF